MAKQEEEEQADDDGEWKIKFRDSVHPSSSSSLFSPLLAAALYDGAIRTIVPQWPAAAAVEGTMALK